MATALQVESFPFEVTLPLTASRKLSAEELDAVRRAFNLYSFGLEFVEVPEVARERVVTERDADRLIKRTLDKPVPGLAVKLTIKPK